MSTQIVTRSLLLGGVVLGIALSASRADAADSTIRFQSPEERYADSAPEVEIDPKQVVRARAMARAKQRAHRMAALNWYGYVPSRPRGMATPFVGGGAFGRIPAFQAPAPVIYRFR